MPLNELFTDIAKSIRNKKGSTNKIVAEDFPKEINNIGEALEVIPQKENQLYKGIYDEVTVHGDENLVPENIAKDVTIFGVQGTHEGGASGGESEYNATIGDYRGLTSFTVSTWLVEIGSLDLSKVTSMASAFYGCTSLIKLPALNCSKATSLSNAFYNCLRLVELGEVDASSCSNLSNVFGSNEALTTLGGFKNVGKAFTATKATNSSYQIRLNTSNLLTHDSLMNLINKLYDLNLTYDVANGGTLYTQSLALGSANITKLTADEIAIATNKGWTIS